jgi:cyclic pyranopterin phosphate synthase
MSHAELTHLDERGLPGMVDVTAKRDTSRSARAQSRIHLPRELRDLFDGTEISSPKGPVVQTAIVAGTMAAKRTSEWIPLCHPLPLTRIKFETRMEGEHLVIECECACNAPTGVEMEALVGATAAALTVYDMGKAVSHRIEIERTRLLWKRGGKSDLSAGPAPRLRGLVLAGGRSRRMGEDKADLVYGRIPQAARALALLDAFCEDSVVSRAPDQAAPEGVDPSRLLTDRFLGMGPLGGILTALSSDRDAAWLVVACDLPLLGAGTLGQLVSGRDPARDATAFLSADGSRPEPLCAIWEPSALRTALGAFAEGRTCPTRILSGTSTLLLRSPGQDLFNANTPEERSSVLEEAA